MSEAYSEPCRTSKTERFAQIVNGFQWLTVFAKRSILDAWQVSEYVSRCGVKTIKCKIKLMYDN